MDDTTRSTTFTIAGRTVTASQPTAEQMFVLQLTRQSQSARESVRTARRLTGILEALLGQSQWDDVIEAGLIDGTVSVEQMMTLATDVFTFDWASLDTPETVTMPTPLPEEDYESEIASALAAGE